MKTLKYLILATIFTLFTISCEKDDNIGGETSNSERTYTNQEDIVTTSVKDNFTIEVLKLDGALVILKDGSKKPILYRNSLTTRNYLQGGDSDYVPTEFTFNKDSVLQITFKRNGANAFIEGTIHGTYAVTIEFKDGTVHEDTYYVKNGPDYYVMYPGGVNTYTQTNNFHKITRPIAISESYYDYRFGKPKTRNQYTIQDKDTTITRFIDSNTQNGNSFNLTHLQ